MCDLGAASLGLWATREGVCLPQGFSNLAARWNPLESFKMPMPVPTPEIMTSWPGHWEFVKLPGDLHGQPRLRATGLVTWGHSKG